MPSVIATLKVKEDKIDEAKQLLRKLVEHVEKDEPGTLAYVPHQRSDDPTTIIFYEKYESQEALQLHSKNLRQFGAEFGAVVAGPPEIVMIDEV